MAARPECSTARHGFFFVFDFEELIARAERPICVPAFASTRFERAGEQPAVPHPAVPSSLCPRCRRRRPRYAFGCWATASR